MDRVDDKTVCRLASQRVAHIVLPCGPKVNKAKWFGRGDYMPRAQVTNDRYRKQAWDGYASFVQHCTVRNWWALCFVGLVSSYFKVYVYVCRESIRVHKCHCHV